MTSMLTSMFQRSLWRSLSSNHSRGYHAAVLSSNVSTTSPEFTAKAAAMDELVRDLEEKMATARQGGGTKSAERMRAKGKKLPRERFVPKFSLQVLHIHCDISQIKPFT